MSEARRLGTATVSLPEEVKVGSYHDFALTYTAGFFGVDDSGSIKVCFRFATDMGTPQFADPDGESYVRVSSNASVTLVPRFDPKDNVRPWGRTIYIKVTNGFLVEGDRIEVRFGPRYRMQSFCESSFEFRVLVDLFACYRYEEAPSPMRPGSLLRANEVRLIPDRAVRWRGQGPSVVETGELFALRIRGEDGWGNPSALATGSIRFEANRSIEGLPESVVVDPASQVARIEGLQCRDTGAIRIRARTESGEPIPIPPIVASERLESRLYWADLHGQSEETIGTNSIDDYFTFARDLAWLDVAAHQGNDFQITREFWAKLQATTCDFYEPGRFVTFPGYEWSANTGLGGDHNVYFLEEGETIHRSCHALVDDTTDLDTDCSRIDELYAALSGREAMLFAHVGGRYASLPVHDPALRRSVEVHSAWGTFLWLLEDALTLGYRVGVVCNSDGHKGRPGASYPGASTFGAYGGLTCLTSSALTREAIWEAYAKRHHYGTTGARIVLSVEVTPGESGASGDVATMGDIVPTTASRASIRVGVHGTAPVERVELRNGPSLLETIHPYDPPKEGRRIRVLWEGAAFRGRGRQIDWNGGLTVIGNRIDSVEAINFYHPDRSVAVKRDGERTTCSWDSFTTGGVSGVILTLELARGGTLGFDAGPVTFELPIAAIGPDESPYADSTFDAVGIGVRVRVSRLPDVNEHLDFAFEREVSLEAGRDNPLYLCVLQEDGHLAWSSPVYLVR